MSNNTHWPKLVYAIAQNKDKVAFAAIFDFFAPRLEAYLRGLGLDGANAEEVCQDTMITLWHKAHLFDASKASLATWLYRIARNRRIDIARRDRLDFFDPMESSLNQKADERPNADVTMDVENQEDRVKKALNALPQEQAELIQLSFYQELSHSQIATKTGLPLGTIKSRIRLAFTRLRRVLENEGIVELNP